MRGDRGPRKLDAVLTEVLEKHGVRARIERLAILDEWSAIVGERLAEVTRVKGLDDRALFVEVRSSAWMMELSMMKEAFLERVNERLGDASLEKIVFVLAETQ